MKKWIFALGIWMKKHITGIVFLLAIAATTVFYFDVVFQQKTLLSPGGLTAGVMGDEGAYKDINPLPPDFSKYAAFLKDLGSNAWAGEPQVAKAAQAFRNWDLPLWNDNMGMGTPLAANFLSTAFYPLKIILYILPNVNGWEIYLLARFVVATFFFFLFMRELKIKTLPSIIASIAFTFSGYFVLFQNIQNMDVDLLAPMMFWVVAYAMNLAKAARIRWYQYLIAVGALSIVFLSNVPESLWLVLAAGFAYWVYRLWASYATEREHFKPSLLLCLKIVIPVGLIVLPLYMVNVEFIQNAFSMHESSAEVGTNVYIQPDFVAYYILPYIHSKYFLLPEQGVSMHALNYFGIAWFFLLLVGVVSAIKFKGSRLFMLVLGILTLAKVHGVPVVNEVIGNLPGFDRILYMKYAQPILSICAATLLAYGLQALIDRAVKAWQVLLSVVLGLGLLAWAISKLPDFTLGKEHMVLMAVYVGLLLILAVPLLMPKLHKARLALGGVLGLLVLAELWVLVPREGRPERYETMTKPPFVSFLQTKKEPYRIFAYDGLLYPDISSTFNLDDIRNLDGLYVDSYYTYIRFFVSHTVVDRFTGKKSGPGESIPAKILDNPFVDILNVKYLVAQNPPLELYPENEINNVILGLNPPTPSLREAVFDINADMRRVLFEHTPGIACAPLEITRENPVLRFSIGIDQQAWENGSADGVHFVITGPKDEILFEQLLNPVESVSDQAWIEQSINLAAYANTQPTLCLHTEPVGNTVSDWAGWADLRLTPQRSDVTLEQQQQAKLVYRGTDAYIYENTRVEQRGFTVGRVTTFNSEDEVIKHMRQADFDPTTEAVVLNEQGQLALPEFDGETCSYEVFENYQESKASLVSFDVYSPGDCFLVFSDTDYPGWQALVDGQKVHIYNTDLMLRGIVLTQGRHHVVMRYQPISFYGSLVGTGAGLILSIMWAIRFSRKPETKNTSSKR